jgi:hypothetical protein
MRLEAAGGDFVPAIKRAAAVPDDCEGLMKEGGAMVIRMDMNHV